MNYKLVSAAIASTALVAFVGGVVMMQIGGSNGDIFAPCRAGVVGGGAIGGPFTLVDENGQTVTEKEVITGPTLIYFGYTFCPDVCPLDNIRNAEAVDLLEAEGIEINPVFISFDPQRDTPEVLRDFTDAMHPRMLGLTGTEEQIKAASQAYKTYYKRQEDGGEYYLIDHSTFSYFMMPEHGFVEFFNRDASAQDVDKCMAFFVNAAS